MRERGFSMKLTHGESACLYPGKGFALPAVVIQSLVVCVITEFFLVLDREGFNPVFDFHDAVLCSKPITKEEANGMVLPIIEQLIRLHELFWPVQDAGFVKVKNLQNSKELYDLTVLQADVE